MGPVATAAAGVVGLAVGSFVNTFIDRWPRGQSVIAPPSRCDRCGRRLRPLEMVPVLSWIALRGRCRTCRAPIGWQAPVVEAMTGVLFAAVAATAANGAQLMLGLGFVAVLVAVAGVDLRCQLIPDVALLTGAGWALLVNLLIPADEPAQGLATSWLRPPAVGGGGAHWAGSLGAAAVAGAVFQVLRWGSRGGLGFGDVKLAAWLGLYLGPRALPVALFAAALLGGLVATGLLVTRRRGRRDAIPFGPFLAVGGLVGWFGGEALWAAYVGVGLR